ncbi:unnamed protein product [Cyprideis torosa]|uniref:Uncharacterized protein n=1 Tax=Cyprideis torosa TaxID=163714 RepID=A0A7R8WC93_9CRUS|nr:unnamed protein product [Cyprideis torosa]CAG0893208.1 unnamed protein product [Cyprideis torosa]
MVMRLFSFRRNHLYLTRKSTRDPFLWRARVVGKTLIAPAVVGLTLFLPLHYRLRGFHPGQWVDFMTQAKLQQMVGGYSICSSLGDLKHTHIVELAIRFSNNPVTRWIFKHCRVGNKVDIRIGGDVYLDVTKPELLPEYLVLVGGGVGVSPLMSILRSVAEVKGFRILQARVRSRSHVSKIKVRIRPPHPPPDTKVTDTEQPLPPTDRRRADQLKKIIWIQSAKQPEDLLFMEETMELASKSEGLVSVHYFVTQDLGRIERPEGEQRETPRERWTRILKSPFQRRMSLEERRMMKVTKEKDGFLGRIERPEGEQRETPRTRYELFMKMRQNQEQRKKAMTDQTERNGGKFDLVNFHEGRLDRSRLMEILEVVSSPSSCTAFLCGPGEMMTDVTFLLNECHVGKVLFEKWW